MKKTKSILLFFFSTLLSSHCLLAQANIDSLKIQLNSFPNDTAGINKIIKIADSYGIIDLDAHIVVLEVAEEKAIILKDPALLCKIYLDIGKGYIESSKSVEASNYILKAKMLAEFLHNEDLLIEMHLNLGLLYYINREFKKALEEFELVIKMATKPQHLIFKYSALNNIGGIYYYISGGDGPKLAESISYLKKGIEIAIQFKRKELVFNDYCNLGLLYCEIDQVDSAENYLRKAGNILLDTSNTEMLMVYNSNMGRLYFQKKLYNKAIDFMGLTIQYARQMNLPEWIYNSIASLSRVYEAKGDYKNALQYYQEYSTFKDSVISQENFAKAADIQNKYEREKKEKELITLQKDNEIQENQMMIINNKREKTFSILLITIGVLILLSALVILLLKSNQSKRRAYRALQLKNEQIREQSIELSQQAKTIAKFQTQMNPHFVFNALNSIQGLIISDENEKVTSQIQSLAQLMRRTFINAEKEDIPLQEEIAYLQNYIEFEKYTSNTNIDFNIEVSPDVESVLIPSMMIQPFIENSMKHAKLETVPSPFILVQIKVEDGLLSISIRDNGIGIKKKSDGDNLSHSMSVVKSRIQILFQKNNTQIPTDFFVLKTVPEIESGTLIKFALPLNYLF